MGKDQIKQDLLKAMKDKDELALSVLRMLSAEIHKKEIELKKKEEGLSESEIQQVVVREIKKRHEAQSAYMKGGREDSAKAEEKEAEVLKKYAPEQLSESELASLVDKTIKETGAVGMQDMGRVMSEVMREAGSAADGTKVNALVKEKLQND